MELWVPEKPAIIIPKPEIKRPVDFSPANLPGTYFAPPTAVAAIVPKSMLFNGTNQYLTGTVASSSPNRKQHTLSWWFKTGSNVTQIFHDQFDAVGANSELAINMSHPVTTTTTRWLSIIAGTQRGQQSPTITNPVGAWHHAIFAIDTAQATADNRVRTYYDGVELSDSIGTLTDPALNEDQIFMINGYVFGIGNFDDGSGPFYNGRLAFFQFIDGLQLTAADLGQTVSTVWSHKKYTGSFGTNGVYFTGGLGSVSFDIGNSVLGGRTNVNGVSLDADVPPFVTV